MRSRSLFLLFCLATACSDGAQGSSSQPLQPQADAGSDTDSCVPSQEVCDGLDNDCNGSIDEGLQRVFYRDDDGDGYGTPSGGEPFIGCSQPDGYSSTAGDCDDGNAAVHPGASESCDGLDNDCNGLIDDGLAQTTVYPDKDGDGVGSWTSGSPAIGCKNH